MDQPPVAPRSIKVQVCTIAARNYLPRARILAESLQRHGGVSELVVFLVDDPEGRTPDTDEPFSVLALDDLPLSARDFGRMTIAYSLTELATAVKPSVLAALANPTTEGTGVDQPQVVVYLDPDTELFAPLEDLWATCVEQQALLLTPHALKPFPHDGLRLGEDMLRLSGVFNLGFIAVPAGPLAETFLPWWAERLRLEALIDVTQGLFCDQRWMDLAPTLFPCHVVDDPGVNVAYWNLHERPLRRRGEKLYAGGAPLRLFHYSGFDERDPALVSRFQHDEPRIVRSASPELGELLDSYAERLLRRAGDEPAADEPYRWDHLPNGLALTPMLRRLYWSEVRDHEEGTPGYHPRPPDPTDADWIGGFTRWLCEPVPQRSLPRFVETLLVNRPDVAATFLSVEPASTAANLGRWLTSWGVEGYGLTTSLALQLRAALDTWAEATSSDDPARRQRPAKEPGSGVDVVGLTGAVSGLSSTARQVTDALKAGGVHPRPVVIEHPDPLLRTNVPADVTIYGDNSHHQAAPVTIACVNADLVAAMGPIGRHQLLGSGYRIGYWWWEVDQLPDQARPALERVDEIWVGSTFVADLFSSLTATPVHRVPLPLRQPTPGVIDWGMHGIERGELLFSFVFDYSSVMRRKNPLGLIDAYCEAFSPGDDCTLVLKSINSRPHDPDVELVRYRAAQRPDIHLIEQRLDVSELDALVVDSTAYISLHRSEGLGLTIADACAMGVPVISSAFGGCMDFLSDDNALLVPVSVVPVGPDAYPYPAHATWGEPDLDVAVRHLRTVANDPPAARSRTEAARRAVQETYDEDMCTEILLRRFALIGGEPVAVGVTP